MSFPDRAALAESFHGEGVELGVASGNFSRTILRRSRCDRLWSIDKWNDHHDPAEYRDAALKLALAGGGRCIPLRMTFAEAALLFLDASLDFIYVDGYAHTGQDEGQTLAQWWPKLRAGGIFAGHDYHPDFPLTVDAVECFGKHHGLTLNLTAEPKYPSWWILKPIAV